MEEKMKKTGKIISFALLSALTFSSLGALTACGENEKNYVAIPYYDGIGTEYNEALFRKNDSELSLPDPHVLEITDPTHPDYGYIYLYGTHSTMACYKSKDLTNWESVSTNTLAPAVKDSGCLNADQWAPAVIYDGGKYYMFLSGTATTEAAGNKVGVSTSGYGCILYMLTSDSPSGPFDFPDYTEQNRAESYLAPDGETTIDCSDPVGRHSYFDMAKYAARVEELEEVAGKDLWSVYNYDGYFSNIDAYPFIDTDEHGNANRYIYTVFRRHGETKRYLCGVACNEDWTPKHETLTLLTYAGYNDVVGTEECPYQIGSLIDEGPAMVKHNGKYYLVYSYGNGQSDYQVGQAVSDSPLGTYRKLSAAENGNMLSNDGGRFDLTGPGGQTLFEKGGNVYLVYHRQRVKGGGDNPDDRVICADKLEWVTVDGEGGENLDVLYTNGPTLNLQPKFSLTSEYSNIADLATVRAQNTENGSSAETLNDGLIAMYTTDSADFNEKYVKETIFTDTATITLTFDDYRTVRALMIYNSKNIATSYQGIKRIEFDCVDTEGNEVTNYIANLKFDWKENRHSSNAESYKHASAAIAEFDEIKCKEIRITIEIPQKGWLIEEDGTLTIPEYDYMTFEEPKEVGNSGMGVVGK